MTIPVKLKRSGTTTATPSSLEYGEIAINYADGVVFYRDSSDVIQSFTLQAYALSSHTHAASDITSGTLDAARIANDSITYAKLQNVSTTDRLLGRSSAGAGDVEEIVCTAFGRSLIDDADAAAARSTLSVQPTASPAFTGAATVTNDGNVVPLTVTNTGTANSFVVNDASGDATPFVVDASGNVGIGTSSPSTYGLFVISGGSAAISPTLTIESTAFNAGQGCAIDFARSGFTQKTQVRLATEDNGASGSSFVISLKQDGDAGALTERLRINSTGQLLVTAGSASAPGVAFSGDPNTGMYSPSADVLALATAGSERVRVDASGNVNVYGADATISVGTNSYGRFQTSGGNAVGYLYGSFAALGDGIHLTYNHYHDAAGTAFVQNSAGGTSRISCGYSSIVFSTGAVNTAPTERLKIDGNGNILIAGAAAATSAVGAIHIKNGTAPSASITDGVVLFAADVSSSSELRVRDEAGNTTTLSPHAFPLIPDGPSEPMAWAYYSERDGRRINVDMLRVVRLLEQLTGEKLVYED